MTHTDRKFGTRSASDGVRSTTPRRSRSGFHWLLALLLLAPALAVAQQPPGLPPADAGTALFRGLLHFHKIEPVSNPQEIADHSKLIVVILGNRFDQDVMNAAHSALSRGGAVLFASDLAYGLDPLLPSGGKAAFVGYKTQLGPAFSFRGTIVPVQPTGLADLGMGAVQGGTRPEMTLFAPFSKVEVDGAGYLQFDGRHPPELARTVAVYPPDAWVGTARGLTPATDKYPFAAAGAGPADNPYRCVAVADPDVFSNKLLYASGRLQNPNDNLKFANNLVQWLKGPQGRTHCLFIEHGQVVTKFDEVKFAALTGPNVPMPPVPTIDPFNAEFQQRVTDFANDGVARVQDDDRLVGPLTNDPQKKAYVYAALAVVVAVIAYLLLRFRSLAGRFRPLFRPLPKDPHMLGPDAAVGSLEHRRLELLRSGNYAAPVRSYVRQLFEDRGLPPGYDDAKLPPIDFDVRNPDYLRRSVRTLWAEVQSAAPVNYGRWKELEPMLAALRAAADDDRWRFAPDDEGDA